MRCRTDENDGHADNAGAYVYASANVGRLFVDVACLRSLIWMNALQSGKRYWPRRETILRIGVAASRMLRKSVDDAIETFVHSAQFRAQAVKRGGIAHLGSGKVLVARI